MLCPDQGYVLPIHVNTRDALIGSIRDDQPVGTMMTNSDADLRTWRLVYTAKSAVKLAKKGRNKYFATGMVNFSMPWKPIRKKGGG